MAAPLRIPVTPHHAPTGRRHIKATATDTATVTGTGTVRERNWARCYPPHIGIMRVWLGELWMLCTVLCAVHGADYEYSSSGAGYDYYAYEYGSSSSSEAQVEMRPKPKRALDHKRYGGTGKAKGCTSSYPETSTMCLYEDDPDVIEYGFSAADIHYIVKVHNIARGAVKASDMAKMFWDDKLAEIAQKKAQSCTKGHDSNINRRVPGYDKMEVGQNYCAGMSLINCLDIWLREKKQFTYGDRDANNGKMVGHYTQMVNRKAIGVGCGFADCWGKGGAMIYCNYAYGQTASEVNVPYTKARRRKLLCPAKYRRKDMLCNFGLKYCFNTGSLDVTTGDCNCVAPYIGDDCSKVDCKGEEDKKCGVHELFQEENCEKYVNLISYCPRMCGLCD